MDTWTNERGNEVATQFVGDIGRYPYDVRFCATKKGWKQYDTDQDAGYFGVWVHVEERKVMTYAEGDESLVECPTIESFRAELQHMSEFYGDPLPAFTVIDSKGGITKIYDERPTA